MSLLSWLKPRTAQKSQPRTRLGVQQLEARDNPAWLAQIGTGPDDINVRGTAMDAAGNMYVCGNYWGAVDFDPGAGTTPHMTLTAPNPTDGYVVKYSPDGTFLWVKRFGGTTGDVVQAVSVDPTGQWVYATGSFTGAADFTGDGVADKTSVGSGDIFVLKLSAASGTTSWVRTVGSAGNDVPGDVAATSGFVYVTGGFAGAVDFDPGPGTRTLTPAGKGKNLPSDGFVLKLDAAGNHAASWQVGGASADEGNSLVADGDTVYLAGQFQGTVDFNPGTAVSNKTSAGQYDFFLASYSTATTIPTLNWVQAIGNADYQSEGRLAGDSGSLYFTGPFTGVLDFDPGAGVTNLTAAGTDVFAARYAKANGSLAWARQFGGSDNEGSTVTPVVDETSGAVYVGGAYRGAIDLNPAAPGGEYTSTSSSDQDGFLVRLGTANGTYQNSWRVGGPGLDGSIRPVGVRAGTLYTTGSFWETASFPTGESLTSQGAGDLFLMALDQFTAGPAVAGSPFTLTASNFVDTDPATTTTQVAFYADSNGDGVLDPATDALLGYGTQTANGTWTLSVTFLAPGTYKLFAQGQNSLGGLSDPLALDLQVL